MNGCWHPLEDEPQVGDVLMYDDCALVVLILRRYMTSYHNYPEVDVMWLVADHDEQITNHYGTSLSWSGWSKL